MKRFSFFLLFGTVFSIIFCRTNQFNKAGKPHGRWEFHDSLGTQVYKYGGR